MQNTIFIASAVAGIALAIYVGYRWWFARRRLTKQIDENFISMIVHELRAPLGAIHKMSEALEKPHPERKDDAQKREEYIHLIHQNSSSMLELVDDLLDVSKIEAGKFEIRPALSDFGETIINRVLFFRVSAEEAHVNLVSIIDPLLPKQALFDPEALKQIFNNLISNALKFTKAGSTVTVAGLVHVPGQSFQAELAKLNLALPANISDEQFNSAPYSLVGIVIDRGIGITPENMSSLFQKFKQLKNDTHAEISKGTGLGLSIAKSIVEEHKGHIGAVSEPGVGSAFYFVIPLTESQP